MAYSTGGLNLKNLRVSYEKNVTIDDIVREANEINKKAQSRKLKFGDLDGAEALMAELRKQHPQFCESYPIVFRYICQMQEYDPKALRQWLKSVQKKPWTNNTEAIEYSAKYVGILFRVTCQKNGKRYNQTQIAKLEANIKAMLIKEYEQFKHYAEECEKEVNAEEKIFVDKNNADLVEFAKICGAEGFAKAETFRVETEIPTADIVDVDQIIGDIAEKNDTLTADDLLG